MGVYCKHYVVIGEKITGDEWVMYSKYNDDDPKFLCMNPYSGTLYLKVEEILHEDEYSIGMIDLPALLEKYPPEKIHIFTRFS